ncbi:MAG: serine/threonine protein kinase [Muribaculaceae bacterium]|nr:serine/threonine protein kinase [Muribaculaceae bacterium]
MTDDKKKNALPYGYVLDSGVYRYTVRSVLGMGGFGITYYGELKTRVGNINVDVPIAIKEFFPASLCERLDGTSTMSYSNPTKDQVERARKDFMGEARRLNSLANKHPNIVAVNEVFETNNTAYYVMEYLEGVSLDKYIKENGPMDEGRMLEVMRPIIDAVAFLHRHRVTHLDIKPANIMIVGGTVDTPERPVLIDFGLSKHYDAAGNATSTINSSGFSDGYAPKEQYRGITTFSPASDVYALGATMLYCLTGQRLPSSLDLKPGEVAGAIPAGVSPGLRRTLERALALDKEDRYLDAGALLVALPVATLSNNTLMGVRPDVIQDRAGNSKKTKDNTPSLKNPFILALIVCSAIAICLTACGQLFTIDEGKCCTGYNGYYVLVLGEPHNDMLWVVIFLLYLSPIMSMWLLLKSKTRRYDIIGGSFFVGLLLSIVTMNWIEALSYYDYWYTVGSGLKGTAFVMLLGIIIALTAYSIKLKDKRERFKKIQR